MGEISRSGDQRIEVPAKPAVAKCRDELTSLPFEATVQLDEASPFAHRSLAPRALEVALAQIIAQSTRLLLHGTLERLINLLHEYVDVIQVAEQLLELLAPLHDPLRFTGVSSNWLQEVAKSLGDDPCLVETLSVLDAHHLPQIHQEVGGVGLDLVCQDSRKAHLGLLGE